MPIDIAPGQYVRSLDDNTLYGVLLSFRWYPHRSEKGGGDLMLRVWNEGPFYSGMEIALNSSRVEFCDPPSPRYLPGQFVALQVGSFTIGRIVSPFDAPIPGVSAKVIMGYEVDLGVSPSISPMRLNKHQLGQVLPECTSTGQRWVLPAGFVLPNEFRQNPKLGIDIINTWS